MGRWLSVNQEAAPAPPQLTTASLNFPDRTVRNKSLLFKSLPIYDSWLEQLKSAQTTPSIWVQNVKFVSH